MGRENIVRVVRLLPAHQHAEIVAAPRSQPGIRAGWKRCLVRRANAVVVIPLRPGVAIQHRDTALGAEPDAVLRVDGQAVYPLVYQFFLVLGEFHRIEIDTIGAVPGAHPVDAVALLRERVDPVIGETVHREEDVPPTILVTRRATCIGTEPLVTLAIDTDCKDIFVRQTILARKGVSELLVIQPDFHDAHGCTNPERIGRLLYRKRTHVDARTDFESFNYFIFGGDDIVGLLATACNEHCCKAKLRRKPQSWTHRCRVRT